jgi:hypothetical protein
VTIKVWTISLTCSLLLWNLANTFWESSSKTTSLSLKSWTRCHALRRKGESFSNFPTRIREIHSVLVRIGDICRFGCIYLYQSCFVVRKMLHLYCIYNDHPHSPSYTPMLHLGFIQTVLVLCSPSNQTVSLSRSRANRNHSKLLRQTLILLYCHILHRIVINEQLGPQYKPAE